MSNVPSSETNGLREATKYISLVKYGQNSETLLLFLSLFIQNDNVKHEARYTLSTQLSF